MNGTKQMAQRAVNAENAMVENIMYQFGFSQAEAEKILSVYRREKIAKLDIVNGRYNLVHGAFWDKDVMQRALGV